VFPIIPNKWTKRENSQKAGQNLVLKYIYMTADIVKI